MGYFGRKNADPPNMSTTDPQGSGMDNVPKIKRPCTTVNERVNLQECPATEREVLAPVAHVTARALMSF